jgi:homoserine O-succinyltransferase
VPHSRYNAITRQHFQDANLSILIESAEAGVHMAVSEDQFRRVYFQGHPEYDVNSLLKEYKREILRYFNSEREQPPFPEHYISDEATVIINRYLEAAHAAHAKNAPLPEFPEAELLPYLDNTWTDTAKAIFNNWLGLVYQLTHLDRRIPFMDGIDPRKPLASLALG